MTVKIIYRYCCDLDACDNTSDDYTNTPRVPLPQGWLELHYREELGDFRPVITKHFCRLGHSLDYEELQMPDFYTPLQDKDIKRIGDIEISLPTEDDYRSGRITPGIPGALEQIAKNYEQIKGEKMRLDGLVIAFDCDGTLDISTEDPGPIAVRVLDKLMEAGVTVGICGNTEPIVRLGWDKRLHFLTYHLDKTISLQQAARLHPGIFYVFVGNSRGDRKAAMEAGWTFVHADEFHYGG